MRPLNVFIGCIGVLLGAWLTGFFTWNYALLAALVTVVTFTGGANAINDYFDYPIDRINRPERPIPSGLIPVQAARIFAYILFAIGAGAAATISLWTFLVAAASEILIISYSKYWKRQPVVGNFVVSLMIGVAFVFGALAFGHPWAALPPAFMGFVYTWGREIIKDLEDVEGDAAVNAKTLPLVAGVAWSKFVTTFLFGVLIIGVLIPYLVHIYNIYFFIMVMVGVDIPILYITIQLWKSRSAPEYHKLSTLLKADMFIGLLAVFIGTF